MEFTGERFVPEVHGIIELEHLHRYLIASELVAGKKVLDIASGEGYGSAMLARKAEKIIGVDISHEAIQFARKRYRLENLEFKVGSCTDIPLAAASLDVVVSFETIEHIEQHDTMMREIKRVLKPGGLLIISSPDKYYYSLENDYHNPFHKKELFEHEFKQLLNRYFKDCRYFRQRVLFGSGITAEMRKTYLKGYFYENNTIKEANGLEKPTYWIGLASDLKLPDLPSSIFEQPIDESEIVKSWRKVTVDRDHQIQELEEQLSGKENAIKILEVELSERNRSIANLESQLSEHLEVNAKLHSKNIELEDKVSVLKMRLDEDEKAHLLLQKIMTEQEKQISEMRTLTITLEHKLDDLQRCKSQREEILQNLNSTLLEIYSSTAWKISQRMWKLRLWLAPKNSRREKFGRTLMGFFVGRRDVAQPSKSDAEGKQLYPVQVQDINNAAKSERESLDYQNAKHPWRKEQIERFFTLAHNQYPLNSQISHFVLLPLLSTGGAEFVASNFIKSIIQTNPDATVLFIVTDLNIIDRTFEIPTNVIFLNLNEFLNTIDTFKKKIFVYDLIKTIRPLVIHNINSSVMWELIIEKGNEIRQISKIFANIFCFQFNDDGSKTGYAEFYMRDAIPYLDGLISDNKRFIHDAVVEYDLHDVSDKVQTIYTPARAISDEDLRTVKLRLAGYADKVLSTKRLKCIWAGRLDAQKKWDLFLSIVKECDFCDFDMYGKSVIDEGPQIPDLPNLKYCGTFVSSRNVFLENDYDVFIFTSQWEGIPTILLDAGIYGVPIIAPTVGGVGELVTNETGYPLEEQASVEDYLVTLKKIKNHPEETAKRGTNMLDLVLQKHSWNKFVLDVKKLNGYLEESEKVNQ